MATLFATTVASAKPAAKDYKLSDGAGLYLLVRPNGSKLWRFNYVHHGKHRTLAFGAWPDVGLADARGKRDEARRLVAAGLDPSHEEKVARAKARVEENDTFKTVAKEWIAKLERENMAEITLSKIRWLLDMAYPKIGNRPIAKITTQEVLVVLRAVEATGRYESARRMRSVLGRVFRYAVATTRAERDPTGDLRGALTVPKAKHLAAITNPKRVYRLYREDGLSLRFRRPRRNVSAANRERQPAASAPNEMWSMDFVSDALFDGRRLRALTVVDAFTREALAIVHLFEAAADRGFR